MSRFTPWNQHPRACVIPSTEYDITNESDRVKASMAGILANVWIFNAGTKARKEINMGGIFHAIKSVPLPKRRIADAPPVGHINCRCVAVQICCRKCGATKVGLLDGFCFNCRP